MLDAYWIVMLPAPRPVWEATRRYNTALKKFMDASAADRSKEEQAYLIAGARLLLLMRQELKVDPKEDIPLEPPTEATT